MAVVSESDLADVTEILGPFDYQHLFVKLGIEHRDIQNAEESAGTNERRLRAAAVLRWWKQRKGPDATREAILQALLDCRLVYARYQLMQIWNMTDSTSAPNPSHPHGSDQGDSFCNLQSFTQLLTDICRHAISKVQVQCTVTNDITDIYVSLEFERRGPIQLTCRIPYHLSLFALGLVLGWASGFGLGLGLGFVLGRISIG